MLFIVSATVKQAQAKNFVQVTEGKNPRSGNSMRFLQMQRKSLSNMIWPDGFIFLPVVKAGTLSFPLNLAILMRYEILDFCQSNRCNFNLHSFITVL